MLLRWELREDSHHTLGYRALAQEPDHGLAMLPEGARCLHLHHFLLSTFSVVGRCYSCSGSILDRDLLSSCRRSRRIVVLSPDRLNHRPSE